MSMIGIQQVSFDATPDGKLSFTGKDQDWHLDFGLPRMELSFPLPTRADTGTPAFRFVQASLTGKDEVRLDYCCDQVQLGLELRISCCANDHFLVRALLKNQGQGPVTLERLDLLTAAGDGLGLGDEGQDLGLFRNGWQSWSHSAYHRIPQWQENKIRFKFVHRIQEHLVNPPKTNRWSSETVTVLEGEKTAVMFGNLTYADYFMDFLVSRTREWTFEARCHLDGYRIGPGQSLEAGSMMISFGRSPSAMLQSWAARVSPFPAPGAGHQGPVEKVAGRVSWCSWYCLGRKVSASALLDITRLIKESPTLTDINLIQLDDGYQRAIGDWLEPNSRFPGGLAPVVQKVRDMGYEFGIWVSPFIVEHKSSLIRNHPDWFVKDPRSGALSGGWNPVWMSSFWALDLTNPEVQKWLHNTFSRMKQMGITFFKLDYLYPAALPGGRYQRNVTRAQALRMGLKIIREAVGDDATILGCGAPLGPCIGMVDAMRISADVASFWKTPPLINKVVGEDELHGRFQSVRSTLARSFMNRRLWMNDPDVAMLKTGKKASEAEVFLQAAVIASSGGLVMMGDDPRSMKPEEINLFKWVLDNRMKWGLSPDGASRSLPRWCVGSREDGTWLVVGTNLEDRDRQDRANLIDFLPGVDLKTLKAVNARTNERMEIKDGQVDLGTIPAHGAVAVLLKKM